MQNRGAFAKIVVNIILKVTNGGAVDPARGANSRARREDPREDKEKEEKEKPKRKRGTRGETVGPKKKATRTSKRVGQVTRTLSVNGINWVNGHTASPASIFLEVK